MTSDLIETGEIPLDDTWYLTCGKDENIDSEYYYQPRKEPEPEPSKADDIQPFSEGYGKKKTTGKRKLEVNSITPIAQAVLMAKANIKRRKAGSQAVTGGRKRKQKKRKIRGRGDIFGL